MSNKILIFTIILLVLPVFVLADDPPPPPWSGGNGGDDTTYDSTLQITEIIADVDGKKGTITSDGEKISKEAKQESDIDFEINLKNIWDKKIEDIEVEVILKDIDDGDDLKEDAIINSLGIGASDTVDLKFGLPLKIDDNDYNVEINIKGRDQDNNLHIQNWGLILEVKKDKHNVIISKASLIPSILSCSSSTNLGVGILNLGSEDEEVKIEVKNQDLSIDLKQEDIELETGTDTDAEYEKTFALQIPTNAAKGIYPINIKVYYNDGRFARTKDINLEIKDCKQVKQEENSLLVKTTQQTSKKPAGKTQTPKSETTISYTNSEPFILLLILFLIILFGVIIFLVGAIIIELRK